MWKIKPTWLALFWGAFWLLVSIILFVIGYTWPGILALIIGVMPGVTILALFYLAFIQGG